MKNEVRRYKSFTDDFSETANQNFKLPPNYRWLRRDFLSRILSFLIYAAALIFSNVYCRIFLKVRFKNKKVLKESRKTGAFIYGNHTQPVGDVFNPALAVFPKRIYTIVSPANYGIPIIGKILPYLGALPTADTLSGLRKLKNAIEYRLEKGNPIVIYPEAHVWEYYTKIRPFPDTSFSFPVKSGSPVFAMTVTYKKSKFFKKPLMEVYIDGPFFGEKADLHREVSTAMQKRSSQSNFDYIEYKEKVR